MEELMEMRQLLQAGRYPEALVLLGEMEEMARDEKINKIESFLNLLLLHLIKQRAEKRTTRSWEVSIKNALLSIVRSNKRRKAGGYYLDEAELREAIHEIYPEALSYAATEAFEGQFTEQELAATFDQQALLTEAGDMVVRQFGWPTN